MLGVRGHRSFPGASRVHRGNVGQVRRPTALGGGEHPPTPRGSCLDGRYATQGVQSVETKSPEGGRRPPSLPPHPPPAEHRGPGGVNCRAQPTQTNSSHPQAASPRPPTPSGPQARRGGGRPGCRRVCREFVSAVLAAEDNSRLAFSTVGEGGALGIQVGGGWVRPNSVRFGMGRD